MARKHEETKETVGDKMGWRSAGRIPRRPWSPRPRSEVWLSCLCEDTAWVVCGLGESQVRLHPQRRWTGTCDLWPLVVMLVTD